MMPARDRFAPRTLRASYNRVSDCPGAAVGAAGANSTVYADHNTVTGGGPLGLRWGIWICIRQLDLGNGRGPSAAQNGASLVADSNEITAGWCGIYAWSPGTVLTATNNIVTGSGGPGLYAGEQATMVAVGNEISHNWRGPRSIWRAPG